MSSHTEVLAEVQRVLDEGHPAEATIRAIRRLLDTPRRQLPIEHTDHGWPVLRASEVPVSSWESIGDVGWSDQSAQP